MKRRRQKRTRAAMPVKVSANGKSQPACTLDIAASGVRLSGFQLEFAPGSVLAVERGNRRANFRVAWVGMPGTASAGQIGLESLEPTRMLWGMDLPVHNEVEEHAKRTPSHEPAKPEFGLSRSNGHSAHTSAATTSRHFCPGEVELRPEGEHQHLEKAKLREIGKRGCFVLGSWHLPLNARVQMVIKTQGKVLHARGTVRTSERMGAWLDFFDLHGEEHKVLESILDQLTHPEITQ